MKLQRILLSLLCSVAVPVAAVADGNPFADWEQIQSESANSAAASATNPRTASLQKKQPISLQQEQPARTDESIAARTPRRRSSVHFFSPSGGTAPESQARPAGEDSASIQPGSRSRMRLRTQPDETGTQAPDSRREPREKPAEATFQVIRADVEVPSDAASGIEQVAGESNNPFADFLRPDHAAESATAGDDIPELPLTELPLTELTTENISSYDALSIDDPTPVFGDYREHVSSAGFADPGPPILPNTSSATLPVEHTGEQSPSVELRWVLDGDLNVGQKCRCFLVVTNTGGSLVRSVTVEAAIPSGLKVVRATPAPQLGTSSWVIGDLQSDESQTIELVVLPERRGDVNLNAFVRFTGYSTSVFTIQEPLLEVELEGPKTVEVGEQVGYIVRVENPGSGIARNVIIQVALPEELKHSSGSLLSIHIGTLSPGESREARLNVAAVQGGSCELKVQTVADGGLSDRAAVSVAVAEPRLKISIAGPDQTTVGTQAVYEITVSNVGNVPSSNVRAKYRVPGNYRFVAADRGGICRKFDHTIDWFVGTVPPGETTTCGVTLEAGSAGKATHQAGVISEHGKVTMARHRALVEGRARLYLDIAGNQPPPVAGEETVLRVIVENRGSSAADKVGLSCELPPGLEISGAEGPTEHIAENGVMVFRSLTSLDADDQAVYLIRARCLRAGAHQIRVRVASPALPEPVIAETTIQVTAAR